MKSELQYCYKFVTSKSDYTFVPTICQQIPPKKIKYSTENLKKCEKAFPGST